MTPEADTIDQFVAFTFLVGVLGIGILILGLAEKVLMLVSRRPTPPRPRTRSVTEQELVEYRKCVAAYFGRHDHKEEA